MCVFLRSAFVAYCRTGLYAPSRLTFDLSKARLHHQHQIQIYAVGTYHRLLPVSGRTRLQDVKWRHFDHLDCN